MKSLPIFVIPTDTGAQHHTRSPICGHMVNELDPVEVIAHLEPAHPPPAKH